MNIKKKPEQLKSPRDGSQVDALLALSRSPVHCDHLNCVHRTTVRNLESKRSTTLNQMGSKAMCHRIWTHIIRQSLLYIVPKHTSLRRGYWGTHKRYNVIDPTRRRRRNPHGIASYNKKWIHWRPNQKEHKWYIIITVIVLCSGFIIVNALTDSHRTAHVVSFIVIQFEYRWFNFNISIGTHLPEWKWPIYHPLSYTK